MNTYQRIILLLGASVLVVVIWRTPTIQHTSKGIFPGDSIEGFANVIDMETAIARSFAVIMATGVLFWILKGAGRLGRKEWSELQAKIQGWKKRTFINAILLECDNSNCGWRAPGVSNKYSRSNCPLCNSLVNPTLDLGNCRIKYYPGSDRFEISKDRERGPGAAIPIDNEDFPSVIQFMIGHFRSSGWGDGIRGEGGPARGGRGAGAN